MCALFSSSSQTISTVQFESPVTHKLDFRPNLALFKREMDGLFYENSAVENFCSSVYSFPHVMLFNTPRPKKRLKRSPAVKMEPQDPDFVPSSPTDDYPNLTVPSLPPAVDFSFQRKRNKRRTPRKPPPKFPGRSLDKRLRMHCSHCNKDFWAKPTCREGRYVLNHKCSDHPRRQYVVGGWHRKCTLNHYAPCIDFVAHGEEQDDNFRNKNA